jgi:sulfate transport system ATP-binding protein
VTISLQVQKIEKSYRNVKALQDVSFNMDGGKIVVLIGTNGAGKSTLLRIIAALEKPDKGNVLFNNQTLPENEMRKISTLVFQRTAMFNRSVHDNLAYGLRIRGPPKNERF